MIKVSGVTKSFDGFKALDGVDINVPSGAIYGLVGPNGAGKSTVIRCLMGIFKPDCGEITVDGEPVWENPAVKARIAYISDDVYYFLQATTRDMMRFYRGIYPNFDMERYKKLRYVFNIDDKRPIRRLSKGRQKQVAFWLALSCRPELMILDEPVDGLDPVMRRQVWSLIMSDVTEHGTTVLISSHNLRELEDVCDHVGIMNHGKMILERSLDELQDNISKVQIVLREGTDLPGNLQVLGRTDVGRVTTLILRGNRETVTNILATVSPLFVDVLPLTLEEIFIYELGGEDYAVKDIVL